jgi:hypothetical protein
MKKIIYLLLLLSCAVFAQDKQFDMVHKETGKVESYSVGTRVKMRTVSGQKYVGVLGFTEDNKIKIDDNIFAIDQIGAIKLQPKKFETLKKVLLISGLVVVGTGIVLATAGSEAAFLVIGGGSVITIAAGILEGTNRNHISRNYDFKISTP